MTAADIMQQAVQRLQENMAPEDVADLTGMSLQDVFAMQRGLRTVAGDLQQTARDEEIVKLYRAGYKILDIENMVSVAPATIYRALNKAGVPLKRAHRARPRPVVYMRLLEDFIRDLPDGDVLLKQIADKAGFVDA